MNSPVVSRFVLYLCFVGCVCGSRGASSSSTRDELRSSNAGDSGSLEERLVEPEAAAPLAQNPLTSAATGQRQEVDSGGGRSLAEQETADHLDHRAAFRKRAKPLRNIFLGIYKNYKSTYLGNRTSEEYRKKLQDRLSEATATPEFVTAAEAATATASAIEVTEEAGVKSDARDNNVDKFREESANEEADNELDPTPQSTESTLEGTSERTTQQSAAEALVVKLNKLKRRKRKHKYRDSAKIAKARKASTLPVPGARSEYHYHVGPGLNMSLDMSNDIVNVRLNADNLREIMHGSWLSDNSEQGRGKKYDMVTKVLPLFVIPFLIQSAIVPFLVTKLKLLLMKSILVGKLAIFLLIVSAFKNSQKMSQSYEVAPSYWAGEPSRRSELATMATYNGYRVEGKPAAWIN